MTIVYHRQVNVVLKILFWEAANFTWTFSVMTVQNTEHIFVNFIFSNGLQNFEKGLLIPL